MGATPSKKRKEKRRQKEQEEVLAAVANLKEVYAKSALHSFRPSQLLDVEQDLTSLPENYLKGQGQTTAWRNSDISGAATLPLPSGKRNKSTKQRLTFDSNVENHPVLSNLQNKQNARLENMENKMVQIRRHAMEAAAAVQNRQRVQSAPNPPLRHVTMYDRNEQTKPSSPSSLAERLPGAMDSADEEESGEVIPVRVLTPQECERARLRQLKFKREKSPPDPLSLDLLWKGSPLLIALLPVILPVLLLSVIMKSISLSYQDKKKR